MNDFKKKFRQAIGSKARARELGVLASVTKPHHASLRLPGKVSKGATSTFAELLLAENAKRSVEALKRARAALLTPGVVLEMQPDVPLYHADPDMPGRLVQVLGGKRSVGYFLGGRFKADP